MAGQLVKKQTKHSNYWALTKANWHSNWSSNAHYLHWCIPPRRQIGLFCLGLRVWRECGRTNRFFFDNFAELLPWLTPLQVAGSHTGYGVLQIITMWIIINTQDLETDKPIPIRRGDLMLAWEPLDFVEAANYWSKSERDNPTPSLCGGIPSTLSYSNFASADTSAPSWAHDGVKSLFFAQRRRHDGHHWRSRELMSTSIFMTGFSTKR